MIVTFHHFFIEIPANKKLEANKIIYKNFYSYAFHNIRNNNNPLNIINNCILLSNSHTQPPKQILSDGAKKCIVRTFL